MTGIELYLKPGSSNLSDAGYTRDEQGYIYDALLADVLENPRWYLDNFTYLKEFKVCWVDYRYSASKPIKYVKQKTLIKETTTK